MIPAFLEDGNDVVDIVVIVNSTGLSEMRAESKGAMEGSVVRAGMFNCLPCDEEANDIISIALDAGKMGVCVVQRERASDKADNVGAFEEAAGAVGRDIGRGRLLRVAANVEATQR
jgi:hypothetical protein